MRHSRPGIIRAPYTMALCNDQWIFCVIFDMESWQLLIFDLRQQLTILWILDKMEDGTWCALWICWDHTRYILMQSLTWPRPENMDTGWVKRFTHERSLTEFWNKILWRMEQQGHWLENISCIAKENKLRGQNKVARENMEIWTCMSSLRNGVSEPLGAVCLDFLWYSVNLNWFASYYVNVSIWKGQVEA